MNKLFIDSNVYLGFYNSNKPEFRKLLKSLIELSDKIFVTNQIVDEVNRNKLNVFKESIANYLRNANLASILLPEHFDVGESAKVKTWNTKRKELVKGTLGLNKDLIEIAKQIISDISISKDIVSVDLHKVFDNPLKPLTNTIKRARARREMGNPPGKGNDPLGDQINWIQILENIQNVKNLWIVTSDFDYFTEYDKELFLNPLLYEEIKSINPEIQIHIYNKLSDALKDFNSKEEVKFLPTNDELEIISIEEPELLLNPLLNTKTKFFGGGHGCPAKCPNCGASSSFSNGGYLRSKFGGLTYQFSCNNCGFLYDTGDYWD